MPRPADDDKPGWKRVARRREADLEFLGALRVATLEELKMLADRYNTKHAPKWKQVAIARALLHRGVAKEQDK